MSLLLQKFESTEEPTNLEPADGDTVDANGLIYLRERYYDPVLGRFPSLDPIEGTMSQPQSLNRYSYVQNNPVNKTDPSGLCPNNDATCIGAVQRLESLYPSTYIYWKNRVLLPAPGPFGVFPTPTLGPTLTCTPTPTTTTTPQPTVTPTATPFNVLHARLGNPIAWQADEVNAIESALGIHLQARGIAAQNLPNITFVRAANEETGRTIGNGTNFGVHPLGSVLTILMGNYWSQHLKDTEYARWIVNHELNHAFLWNLLRTDGEYTRFGQNVRRQFGTDGKQWQFPTRYAANNFDTKTEFLAEVMTAMIWERANHASPQEPDHQFNSVPGRIPSGTYPYNVHDITDTDGADIVTWILQNVVGFMP